jgi:hypothetical protein
MMTRKELLERIDANGGEWKATDVVRFTRHGSDHDPDGVSAFVIHDGDERHFWLMGHLDRVSEFRVQNIETLGLIPTAYEAAQVLASVVEYDMPGVKPVTIVKVERLEADRALEEHLSGKVEAYEKLLIGRAVTISQ